MRNAADDAGESSPSNPECRLLRGVSKDLAEPKLSKPADLEVLGCNAEDGDDRKELKSLPKGSED